MRVADLIRILTSYPAGCGIAVESSNGVLHYVDICELNYLVVTDMNDKGIGLGPHGKLDDFANPTHIQERVVILSSSKLLVECNPGKGAR